MKADPPPNQPLRMLRKDLENIPEFVLPDGYALRPYQPGDEAHWLEIHRRADEYNRIYPELFAEQFGSDPTLLAQRQFYLLAPRAGVIGTGSAWFKQDFPGDPLGRVHWVAIVPEYQGRGLAKPLMTLICKRLRELGHSRAYLTTSALRHSALQLYLRFGFTPLIENERQQALWRQFGLA